MSERACVACGVGDRVEAMSTSGALVVGTVATVLGGAHPDLPRRICLLVQPERGGATVRVAPEGVLRVIP